jgi:hypothetical protein
LLFNDVIVFTPFFTGRHWFPFIVLILPHLFMALSGQCMQWLAQLGLQI